MDTILTQEGRAQIATGKLNAAFVSFSDAGSIYAVDTLVSGGLDFTYRFNLEASNLPQDLIVFEADDSGALVGTFTSGSTAFQVATGQILSGSSRTGERLPVTGSQFNSLAGVLLNNSSENFKNQYILSSPDPIDDRYNDFIVSPSIVKFEITNQKPLSPEEGQEINIDFAESLFADERLSHIPNFKFLPPVNRKRPGETTSIPLGTYINLNQNGFLTFQQADAELEYYRNNGFEQKIFFTETSRTNNILSQFFEVSNGEIVKLDIIDFGTFPPGPDGLSRHVFYVGKVFTDGYGVTTFINLFTLVWS